MPCAHTARLQTLTPVIQDVALKVKKSLTFQGWENVRPLPSFMHWQVNKCWVSTRQLSPPKHWLVLSQGDPAGSPPWAPGAARGSSQPSRFPAPVQSLWQPSFSQFSASFPPGPCFWPCPASFRVHTWLPGFVQLVLFSLPTIFIPFSGRMSGICRKAMTAQSLLASSGVDGDS
jgi:hypothetical protein